MTVLSPDPTGDGGAYGLLGSKSMSQNRFDGEYCIPGDDIHFHDSVHFTDAGSMLMARRVMTALQQSEPFTKLVQWKRTLTARARQQEANPAAANRGGEG